MTDLNNYDSSDELSDDECVIKPNSISAKRPLIQPASQSPASQSPASVVSDSTAPIGTSGILSKQFTSMVESTFNSIAIDVTVLIATIAYLAYEWLSEFRKLQLEYAMLEM